VNTYTAALCPPLAQWRTTHDHYATIFSTRFGVYLLKILRFHVASPFVPRGSAMACVYTYDPSNTRLRLPTRKGEGRRLPITFYGGTVDDVYAQLLLMTQKMLHG